MTKKHFKWMAEYVAAEYRKLRATDFRNLGCYRGFVDLGFTFNERFDIKKFDEYIKKRI